MNALCRCGHAKHVAQCTAPDGCWCDTYAQKAPTGELTVLREYSCGCIIYLDAARQEINEKGIFCGQGPWYKHRDVLVKGQETQPSLFDAG